MYCCRCSMASTMVPQYLAALLFLCLITSGKCRYSTVSVQSSSEDGEIYAACNVAKYGNGTEFESNVNTVLKSLRDNAMGTGFSTAVYGQESPNKVFGRFQCRGDLSPADCRACSLQAVEAVGQNCSNAIGARVQLEYCFLRYENYTFLSQLDTSFWYGLVNVNSNNDTDFNAAVGGLMADLAGKAPPSTIRFAVGQREVPSSNLTVYGMEMCWRDMSADDCATCLSKGTQELFSCCKEHVGAQVFLGSCTLRYEIYPFAKN